MQGPYEPVQQYLATLKQTARICLFNFKCTAPNDACDHVNNYEDEMVLDQLVNGLYDPDIQAKVLASQEENLTVEFVEKLVKAEELSKTSQKHSKSADGSIAGLSSTYKQGKKKKNAEADQKNESEKTCFNCGNNGHFYRKLKGEEKKKCPAHGKTCKKCLKDNHLEKVCRSKTEGALDAKDEDEQGFLGCFGIIALASKYAKKARQKAKNAKRDKNELTSSRNSGSICGIKLNRVIMGHMEYGNIREEYVPSRITKNHLLDVSITLDKPQYFKLGGTGKKPTNQIVKTEGVADTGAAVCCAPTSEIGN